VHAAGESAPGDLASGTHAVVLSVPNEDPLRSVQFNLRKREIPHIAIEEPDPPWNGQLMAIGLIPTTDKKKISRALGRLPLLKEKINVND
jgi:hypothetical protein